MSRRDESEFPFAYLSENRKRSMPGNTHASPAKNSPASGSRSMTQQIRILLLLAFATVLIFLILLYFTIMTITSGDRKANSLSIQTTITQPESGLPETTALT